jgi:hypothetical protein
MDFETSHSMSRFLEEVVNNTTKLALCEEAIPEVVEVTWHQIVLIVALACLSGTFSGLNLGLLGLDVKNLELITKGPFENK